MQVNVTLGASINLIAMEESEYSELVQGLADPDSRIRSLRQLSSAIATNKPALFPHLKEIMNRVQSFLPLHKDSLSTLANDFLILFVTHFNTPDSEKYIKNNIMDQVVVNLGSQSEPALRQGSHLLLLKYVETYKNFDSLLFHYVDAGLGEGVSWQIQQKAINSFQSIFLLSKKLINWKSVYLQKVVEILIERATHYNQTLSKAAVQALTTMCKQQESRLILVELSVEAVERLRELLAKKVIVVQMAALSEIEKIIKQKLGENPNTVQVENPEEKSKVMVQEKQIQTKTPQVQQNSKLPKTPKAQQTPLILRSPSPPLPNIEQLSDTGLLEVILDPNHEAPFRIYAFQILEPKLQQKTYSSSLIQQLQNRSVQIFALVKHESIRLVSVGAFLTEFYENLTHPQGEDLDQMINCLVEGLGDQRAPARNLLGQIVRSMAVKENKERERWIQNLLKAVSSSNENQKEEGLAILIEIFKDQANLPAVDLEHVLTVLSPQVEDTKTRIKLRAFDCMVEICLSYKKIREGSKLLERLLSPIYFQIFTERLNKGKKDVLEPVNVLSIAEIKRTFKSRSKYEPLKYKESQANPSNMRSTLDIQLQKGVGKEREDQRSSAGIRYRIKPSMKRMDSISTDKGSLNKNTFVRLPNLNKLRDSEARTTHLDSLKSSKGYSVRTAKSRLSVTKDNEDKADGYLRRSDLLPLNAPEKEYKLLLISFQNADWKTQFESINNLRRVTEHHSELLSEGPTNILNILAQNLMKAIDSQRSTLVKNALLCLTEMINKLGRYMDQQIEVIVDKLTRKAADANAFINFEVKKCLNTAAAMLTECKIIQQIDNLKQSKSVSLKDSLIEMLQAVVSKESPIKDAPKLRDMLIYFLDEGSNELKNKARSALTDLCDKVPGFEGHLKSVLPAEGYMKLSSVRSIKPSSVELRMSSVSRQSDRGINSTTLNLKTKWSKADSPTKQLKEPAKDPIEVKFHSPRPIKKKVVKVTAFPAEFDEFEDLFRGCKDSDWRKRIDYLDKTTDLAKRFPSEFAQFRTSSQFIDILSSQMGEHNVKVNSHALEVLKGSVIPLRTVLENNLSIVTTSVFNALSSNKPDSKSLAEDIFHSMISEIDLSLILQHWCFGCLFSLPKSREFLLIRLIRLINKVNETKSALMTKHVLPMLDRLLDDKKTEIVYLTGQLCREIHSCLGDEMSNHVTKKAELKKHLKK